MNYYLILADKNKQDMFTFRKATYSDSQLINNLASQIWEPTYGAILSREQLDYMFDLMYAPQHIVQQMEELHHEYFIISKDCVPSGYLSIELVEPHLYHFQKIYSLPSLHGSGIGRFIIEQGVEYLKSIHPGPFIVELYVNRENPAVGFYKHMGFYEHDTRDAPIGNGYFMNDFVMRLEVNN